MQRLATTLKDSIRGYRHIGGALGTAILWLGGWFVQTYGQPEGGWMVIPWNYFPAVIATILLAAFYFYRVLAYSTELRLKLKGIENLEEILDKLSEHLDYGNREILNALIKNDTEYGAWRERQKKWMKEVEDYLEAHFGLREKNSFKHIVILEYKLRGGVNEEHCKHRNIMAWKLLTIKEIISRYSERTQKWREGSISR